MRDLFSKDNLILYGVLFIILVSIGVFNLDITGYQGRDTTKDTLENAEKLKEDVDTFITSFSGNGEELKQRIKDINLDLDEVVSNIPKELKELEKEEKIANKLLKSKEMEFNNQKNKEIKKIDTEIKKISKALNNADKNKNKFCSLSGIKNKLFCNKYNKDLNFYREKLNIINSNKENKLSEFSLKEEKIIELRKEIEDIKKSKLEIKEDEKEVKQKKKELIEFDAKIDEAVEIKGLIDRKEQLLELIETDPDAALEFPETSNLKSGLKNSLQANIEQRGEFEGEIEVLHVDYFEEEKSEFIFFLRDKNNKRYQLYSSKKIPVMLSGTKVRVKGLVLEDKMALTSLSSGSLINQLAPPDSPASENLGDQKTLVILTRIDNKDSGVTKEQVENLIFGNEPMTISDFYRDNSYQKVSFYGRVVGPYDLPSSCDFNEILSNSVISAFNEISGSEYSRIIIYSPRTSCSRRIGGWGSIGKWPIILPDNKYFKASISWIFAPGLTDNYNPQLPPGLFITAHELGHNFGVHHANNFRCPNNDIYSIECISREYGAGNVMGSTLTQHFAIHKQEIGWLDAKNTITVSASGEFELNPIEIKYPEDISVIQQIKLPLRTEPYFYLGGGGIYISIEFRKYSNYFNEKNQKAYPLVVINMGKFNDEGKFSNLQMHSIKGLKNPGDSYLDGQNNYNIILKEINEDSAKVEIIRKQEPNKQETGTQSQEETCRLYPTLPGCNQPTSFGSSPVCAVDPTAPGCPRINILDSQFMTRLIQSVFLPRYTGDNFIEIWIDVKNTGRETWTKDKFVLKWAGEEPSPWGVDSVELDPGDSIATGQIKTFKFKIYKPNSASPSKIGNGCGYSYTTGLFNFKFRMYRTDPVIGPRFFGPAFVRDICV